MMNSVLQRMAPPKSRKEEILRQRELYEAEMEAKRVAAARDVAAVRIQAGFRSSLVRKVLLPRRLELRAGAEAWSLPATFNFFVRRQFELETTVETRAWKAEQAHRRARRRFARARDSMVGPAKKLASTLHRLLASLQESTPPRSGASVRSGRSRRRSSATHPAVPAVGGDLPEVAEGEEGEEGNGDDSPVPSSSGSDSSESDGDTVADATRIVSDLWEAFSRVQQFRGSSATAADSMLADDRRYYFDNALNEGHFVNLIRDLRLWPEGATPTDLHSLFVRHSVVMKEQAQVVHARRQFMWLAEPSGLLPTRRLLTVVENTGIHVPKDEVLDFKARAGTSLTWEAFFAWWDERRRQAEGVTGFEHDGKPPARVAQIPYSGMKFAGFEAALTELAVDHFPPPDVGESADSGRPVPGLTTLARAVMTGKFEQHPRLRLGIVPEAATHERQALNDMYVTCMLPRLLHVAATKVFSAPSVVGSLMLSRGVLDVITEFQKPLLTLFQHFTGARKPPTARGGVGTTIDDDRPPDAGLTFSGFAQFAHAFYITPSLIPNDVTDGFELLSVFLSCKQGDRAGGKHTCVFDPRPLIGDQKPRCQLCERQACKLTVGELRAIHTIFSRLDADRSGMLDEEELYRFASRAGGLLSDDALRRFMALMDTSDDGLVSLSEFVTALEASISMAKHAAGTTLTFAEFCLATAAMAECGLTKPEFRRLLPPSSTAAVRLRYFMSHLLAPQYHTVIGEPIMTAVPSLLLKADPTLKDVLGEVFTLLNRVFHYYTHLGGAIRPLPFDLEVFRLFVRDIGLFKCLTPSQVGRVFESAAVTPDEAAPAVLEEAQRPLSPLTSLLSSDVRVGSRGVDVAKAAPILKADDQARADRDDGLFTSHGAALARLSPAKFQTAVHRLLREVFLACQGSVGLNNSAVYDEPIGEGLQSTMTPRGLAVRVLLRRLKQVYDVYKPKRTVGSRYARQVYRLPTAPLASGGTAAQAGGDDHAPAQASMLVSLWKPTEAGGARRMSFGDDPVARLTTLKEEVAASPTHAFTDKQDALAYMKSRTLASKPAGTMWSALRAKLTQYRSHQPLSAAFRHSIFPPAADGVVDVGAPPPEPPAPPSPPPAASPQLPSSVPTPGRPPRVRSQPAATALTPTASSAVRWSPIAARRPPADDDSVGWRTRMKAVAAGSAEEPTAPAPLPPTALSPPPAVTPHAKRSPGATLPARFPSLQAVAVAALPRLIAEEPGALTARGVGVGEADELLKQQQAQLRRLGSVGSAVGAPSTPLVSLLRANVKTAMEGLRSPGPLTSRSQPGRRPGRRLVARDVATESRVRDIATRRTNELLKQIAAGAAALASPEPPPRRRRRPKRRPRRAQAPKAMPPQQPRSPLIGRNSDGFFLRREPLDLGEEFE